MNIREDYSYLRDSEKALMNNGYGKLTVHSVHIDRDYSEERKESNLQLAKTMTREEWSIHCDKVAESFAKPMEEILKVFVGRYDIHQVSEATSTIKHFTGDWDLHFWSDRGWNGKDFMTHFTLTFNDRRTPEQNMKLLEEVVLLVKEMNYEDIGCRIQYDIEVDEPKVEKQARNICDNLVGKFINYCGKTGKIRVVRENNGIPEYGFFLKGAKRKYWPVSAREIVAMSI